MTGHSFPQRAGPDGHGLLLRAVSSEEPGDATVIGRTPAAEALCEVDALAPSSAADREAARPFSHQRAPSTDHGLGSHAEGGDVLAPSH
jgi:hypothetical protein